MILPSPLNMKSDKSCEEKLKHSSLTTILVMLVLLE